MKKWEPVKEHKGHKWKRIDGQWGPHKSKYVCQTCGGKFIKWTRPE